jgi:hypothetical protein
MIKVKNENELLSILKVFAQESVNKAKNTLNEDAAQKNYMSALERDTNTYGDLVKEQEDEDAEVEEVDNEEDNKPESDNEVETQPAAAEEELDPEEFGASFDSVVKDLNTLRSGKSTRNKDVKENLLDYYDRLDEEERQILHLFLKELSDILQGAISGEDAQDPSDPPFNLDITTDDEVTNNDKPSNDTQQVQQKGEEDITPPIKVNESQDLYEIRKRVKNLMKRY